MLAEWAAARDRRLVYTSTDLVFDGTKSWNREDDPARPILAYGRTKHEAESQVLAASRGLVVRLSLLYGPSPSGRPGFFDLAIDALRRGEPRAFFEDEFRTPLDYRTAAEVLALLAESDAVGILHVGGRERHEPVRAHAPRGWRPGHRPRPRPRRTPGRRRSARTPPGRCLARHIAVGGPTPFAATTLDRSGPGLDGALTRSATFPVGPADVRAILETEDGRAGYHSHRERVAWDSFEDGIPARVLMIEKMTPKGPHDGSVQASRIAARARHDLPDRGRALGLPDLPRRRDPDISPRRGADPPEELPGMPSARPGCAVLAAGLLAGAEARRRHRPGHRRSHHAALARLDDRGRAVPRRRRPE